MVYLPPMVQVRQLQDAAVQHERERLQQQAAWTQEKQLLERELQSNKEKVIQSSCYPQPVLS